MRCASRSRASSATAKRGPAPRRPSPRARRRGSSSRCARRGSSAATVPRGGVREQVESIVGYGEEGTGAQAPFTPRSKKVLELALREALQLGHNYIGTEHIPLGR